MNEKAIRTLEFPKVRERLAAYTSFSAGRDVALQLMPLDDITQVRRSQRITTEAVRLLSLRPDVSIGGAHDIRELARRAELGSLLEPKEFLAVLDTLRAGRNLRSLILRTHEQRNELEILTFIADGISPLPKVEAEIERCINDEGMVLDSASPALGKIRVNIRAAHSRLINRLQQIIQSDTYARALQEPIITLRDGRYVVPVKSDFKGQLRGIVHDQSNSGATVFVEPLAVVDLGNEWRQLQAEEAAEIERILRELGALVGSHADAIRTNVEVIADIDVALAKGRYSIAIDGIEPDLVEARPKGPAPHRPLDNREKRKEQPEQSAADNPQSSILNLQSQERGLYFKNARHPLLSGNVVPITIELGDRFRILVITGPNTGGKTVALKTVGLLSLMAQAGMHIPANHVSRAVVFKDIFADIGDEQSIEQSLSTFSSHMSNIVNILKWANRESLVLLDELGAGTDPQEGSALARSIITYLLEAGVMAVCTTHYSELKAFAFSTQGVENASVEFDINTLSPTYRLTIGTPGRSNAFAIASRLGLNRPIIEQARRFVDPEAQNVEDVLEGIRREREGARQERSSAESARRELEERRRELDRRLAEVEEIKARAADDARRELEHDLEALRGELRQLRGRVEAGLVSSSDENLTRKWVQDAQVRAAEMERQLRDKETQQRKARNVSQNRHRTVHREEPEKVHVIGPGDTVFVQSLGAEGDVLNTSDGQAEVQVGAFKMRVSLTDISIRRTAQASAASRAAASSAPVSRYNSGSSGPVAAPPLEYDFRGWRAEEAIEEIDRRLDEAARVNMPFLRIIHGKGTGALRKALREFLAKHPLVKEVESAPIEQGGEGVTIVKL